MANTRRLARPVSVAGKWYTPEDDIPADIAAKIKNPKAWATDVTPDDGGNTDDAERRPAGAPTGARLAMRVSVAGKWYTPEDDIPADIAAKIKNPKAWEGGVLPHLGGKTGAGPGAGEGAAAGGPDPALTGEGASPAGGGPQPAAPEPVKAPRAAKK